MSKVAILSLQDRKLPPFGNNFCVQKLIIQTTKQPYHFHLHFHPDLTAQQFENYQGDIVAISPLCQQYKGTIVCWVSCLDTKLEIDDSVKEAQAH